MSVCHAEDGTAARCGGASAGKTLRAREGLGSFQQAAGEGEGLAELGRELCKL